ncbi:unnamed protein product [Parajaminaea phylloscopi]
MPPKGTGSSSSSSAAVASSSKVQVHNAQHSLRAASRNKVAKQQKARQDAAQQGPAIVATGESVQPAASTSSRTGTQTNKEQPRKTVYKQVLGSPLTVNWPEVAPADAQPILYTLLDVLRHPSLASRSRRRVESNAEDRRNLSRSQRRIARRSKSDRDVVQGEVSKHEQEQSVVETTSMDVDVPETQPKALVVGLNTVTRHLEDEISYQSSNSKTAPGEVVNPQQSHPLDLIFICRADLDPPRLVAHFPLLTCAVNAVCHPAAGLDQEATTALRIVPLPEGAEHLLAGALELRRCGVIGLSTLALPKEVTATLVKRIDEAGLQPPRAAWLEAAAVSALRLRERLGPSKSSLPRQHTFQAAPQVLQVATTAPANPNAVKLEKKHTRAEKKGWRKAKRQDAYLRAVVAEKREKKRARVERRQGRLARSSQGSAAAAQAGTGVLTAGSEDAARTASRKG